jgi:glycosyltransferase involved in cell wall biosynthesis
MNEPLVSVKMITYNHALYITQAIEGILQQKTNFPVELVIGEDCSTDGTREVVFEYRKKYPDIIRVVTSDKNVGMNKNGYRTMKACRGKYVAFCEGDDHWHHPDKLQKQVDYLESHPECGLIHSDYDRYFATSGKIIKNFNKSENNIPPDNLDISSILRGGRYLYILTCTVMIRREMLLQVIESDHFLHQSGTFLIGDTNIWAEIAWQSKTHYINESLSTYTVMEESASKSSDPKKNAKFGMSINELFLYLTKKYNLPESEFRFHTENWCRYALWVAFYEKNQILVKEVRKKKAKWSAKEFLLYYGTMYRTINRLLITMLAIKEKINSKVQCQ